MTQGGNVPACIANSNTIVIARTARAKAVNRRRGELVMQRSLTRDD